MKFIFVTTCKPFDEEYSWKQEQSIKSWMTLEGIEKKIIIVGNDDGVAEFTKKNNLIRHPNIKTFHNVPYIVDMLEVAYSHADDNDIIIWTNSDMIYFNDFIETIKAFRKEYTQKDFMMAGRRHDWKTPRVFDLNNKDEVNNILKNECRLHETCGIDYIIHSKTTMKGYLSPRLLIASYTHDMKMLAIGIHRKIPTVDCSKTITAIHHNHPAPIVSKEREQQNTNEVAPMEWIHNCPLHSERRENGEIIFKN